MTDTADKKPHGFVAIMTGIEEGRTCASQLVELNENEANGADRMSFTWRYGSKTFTMSFYTLEAMRDLGVALITRSQVVCESEEDELL